MSLSEALHLFLKLLEENKCPAIILVSKNPASYDVVIEYDPRNVVIMHKNHIPQKTGDKNDG